MSSKSIYPIDPIAEFLGMSPLYNIDYSTPEDATSDTPKGMSWDYYFPGDAHPFLGKTHSDEHKAKLSILMKERRANNPEMGNHESHTEETKNKVSEALIGNTNALGKTWTNSQEFKDKCKKRFETYNPMDNEESRAKCSTAALRKFPCKTCGKEMNKGNLSRHEIKCK